MKFNRLILKNIGAYYDAEEFDLRTYNKEENVILIGGKNGSGKTTILESLRLVLFGSFAYGLRTDSTGYMEIIEAKFNSEAKKKNQRLFQIILEIEIVEDLKKNHYTLNRSWTKHKNNYRETFSIIKNGEYLNDQEIELFQTKLRDETPPQLLEFCLFDGEKISQVVNKDTLSTYLKETAKVMFNLDLFESLESDIGTYLKQENVYTNLSEEEKQLIELEQEINELYTNQEKLSQEIEDTEQRIDENKAIFQDLNRQYQVNGGLIKKERDALIKKMSDIDNRRLSMMEKNREYLTTLFPFVLGRDLLSNVVTQLKKEAKEDLKSEFIRTISIDTFKKALPQDKTLREEDIFKIYESLTELMSSEKVELIHKASTIQRSEVISYFKQVCEFIPGDMLKVFEENTKLIQEVQKIRKKIEQNDNTSDLKDLFTNIQNTQNEINKLELKNEQLLLALDEMSEKIKLKEHEHQNIKQKIVDSRKMGHIFEIASKVTEVSRLFREMQLKKKLQQVELETTRMLQIVYRKKMFVSRVKIDPETFQLKIYDENQEEINIDTISAGEKQILLLSTVWAMAMTSRRRLPFVFDTLLGRLDQTHKKAILEQFIPRCGEQVIILATDSEISEQQFRSISSNIAQCYTIELDSNNSKVIISNNYFGMEKNYEFSS